VKRFLLIAGAIALTVVGGVAYSGWRFHLRVEGRNATLCISNLRKIDVTKEWYGQEHGLKTGDPIPEKALIELRAWPKQCPCGGAYTINPIGIDPICSVPGHTLSTP